MENSIEIEDIEEGVLDAMIIDIPVGELSTADAEPLPTTVPVHPFFLSRSVSLHDNGGAEEQSRLPAPPAPTQIRENARKFLDGPSLAPDSDLSTSTRQQPRAGPYGKRKRSVSSDDQRGEAIKAARGSEPTKVSATDRIKEEDFANQPFLDLDGPFFPLSRGLPQ